MMITVLLKGLVVWGGILVLAWLVLISSKIRTSSG
ncbi:hypothetical protein Q667_10635 [Marinobacter sp. C1S70]|jgi:hypothetical protein|nr:hypothetical protein Q673_17030 [Marinobacter sp. EN3]ERS90151.1 hypothetical protein Q667_10635 [Marinobacter sp. C1S70]